MNKLVYNISFTLDYQLKDYFKQLIKYLKKSSYYNTTDPELKSKYKKRTDGIIIGQQLDETGINILQTHARKVQKTTRKDYPISCPLCLNPQIDKMISPYNMYRALLWRNFIVGPNSFPYFKVHLLIQSCDHNQELGRGTQSDVHKNINIISDILDLIKIIGKGTILFNGWVGNSLGHLHFHYTETEFPIKDKIKSYKFNKNIIKTKNKSHIKLFNDNMNNCKNFILVIGKNPAKDVFTIIQYLDSVKLFYNLTIHCNEQNHLYIYIFIRNKIDDIYNFNFGASNLSGLSLTTDEHLLLFKNNKSVFIETIDNYCKLSLIKIDYETLKNLF